MKAKKFLSILLCLIMMCSLLPMTALAEGETVIITHVDIVNAPVLVAGQKVSSFTAQSATEGITITRPDGYEGFQIWHVTGGAHGVVNGNTVIEAGRTYSIRVFVKTNDGYRFPYNGTVTATINGSAASVGYVADYVNSNNIYRSISLDVTVPEAPVTAVTGITVSPASASVEKGKTQQFTATVSGTGDFDQSVKWSIVGGTSSAISANGLLTVGADETASELRVIAVSAVDPSVTSAATVTVTAPAPPPHTHNAIKQSGQAPTCKNDGWKDYYECDCGLYADEGCTTPIEDLAAWKAGDGKIPSNGHSFAVDYNETHHWSECTAENCDDLDTAKTDPEAHYDENPSDYECDFCQYDLRTQLTSAAFKLNNHALGKKLTDLAFTGPDSVTVSNHYFGIDTDSVPGPDANPEADAIVKADKEYWVALEIEAKAGYILPVPDVANFTLDGIAAEDIIAAGETGESEDSASMYTVIFKLPVLTAPAAHEHSYAQSVYKHDDTYHWQECDSANCDNPAGSIRNKAKHSGGNATCLAKAKCSVCGEEYGKKLAHDYSEWVVVKEPTETAYGKKERTCSMCKGVHMEYIPPLGQNPKTGDTNDVFLWGAALTGALLALSGVVIYSKKKKKE